MSGGCGDSPEDQCNDFYEALCSKLAECVGSDKAACVSEKADACETAKEPNIDVDACIDGVKSMSCDDVTSGSMPDACNAE